MHFRMHPEKNQAELTYGSSKRLGLRNGYRTAAWRGADRMELHSREIACLAARISSFGLHRRCSWPVANAPNLYGGCSKRSSRIRIQPCHQLRGRGPRRAAG